MAQPINTAIQSGAVFQLYQNHPLRLEQSKNRCVTCLSGRVWITAYNELTDFELNAGDSFVVPNDGLALVDAIGECRVRIDYPQRATPLSSRSVLTALLQRIRFSMSRNVPSTSK
jgi:hypothetical protein